MNDNELVADWGGSVNYLFDTFSADEWQADRWKRQWGKHRLLPTKIREIILEESHDETQRTRRKEIQA